MVTAGRGSTLTVTGAYDTITAGDGSNLTVNGQHDTLIASNCTITLAAGTTATIVGTGNTVITRFLSADEVMGALLHGSHIEADPTLLLPQDRA